MAKNENSFLVKLKENLWQEVHYDSEYRKGNWLIIRDTSHWWMIGTVNNPRVFDVPEPSDYTAPWTVNLIEHLCTLNDKITHASLRVPKGS